MNLLLVMILLGLAAQGAADPEDNPHQILRRLLDSPSLSRLVDSFPKRTMQKTAKIHPKFSPELYRTMNLVALRSQVLLSVLNNLGSSTEASTTPASSLRLY